MGGVYKGRCVEGVLRREQKTWSVLRTYGSSPNPGDECKAVKIVVTTLLSSASIGFWGVLFFIETAE